MTPSPFQSSFVVFFPQVPCKQTIEVGFYALHTFILYTCTQDDNIYSATSLWNDGKIRLLRNCFSSFEERSNLLFKTLWKQSGDAKYFCKTFFRLKTVIWEKQT